MRILELDGRGDLSGAGADAAEALETGGLVVLPTLRFEVAPEEVGLLDERVLSGRSKNISLHPTTGTLGGAGLEGDELAALTRLTARYADFADDLLRRLLPDYAAALQPQRTSFRPGEVGVRALSPRKDDRRLHVDAFPSSPVQGRRILRVFSNVDPLGRGRVWEVGEDGFEAVARRFDPRPATGGGPRRWAMDKLKLTRGRRTAYDEAMLKLHDRAKLDDAWQAQAPRRRVEFAAGSSWIVYTDGVLHAALEGRNAFERTFLMPIAAMREPSLSPLRTLERMAGAPLA